MPDPPSPQGMKKLINNDEEDEELDLDFLNIMDKALLESKLQKDHPSASGTRCLVSSH